MSIRSKKILVIDDETQITRVLKRTLVAQRYDVRTAPNGETGLEIFNDFQPDLVITDLSMPEMSGIEVCREIRKLSQIPILVLSVKGEERTKVEALDAGADDYITKPFGIEELLARLRAVLRRVPDEADKDRLKVGDFLIDISGHRVFVNEKQIHLTPKEFELLVYLVRNHGKVITHRNLLAAVWGTDYTEQMEYLRVFLANLRKKIEPNPGKPIYILTEPWIGYRFDAGLESVTNSPAGD